MCCLSDIIETFEAASLWGKTFLCSRFQSPRNHRWWHKNQLGETEVKIQSRNQRHRQGNSMPF